MKKYYNLLLTLVALAMTAMAFTACDEEVKAPTQNPADAFPKKHDTALLLVTFGSTYDVPQQTFDKQKAYFQKQFPNTDLYLSYTSRIIINRMQAQGKEFIPPAMWMQSFLKKNYKNVYVQSFHVIPGEEFTLLRDAYVKKEYNVKLVDDRKGRNDAVLGHPLLYSHEDIQKVAKILVDDHKEHIQNGEVVAFMGHGNPEENYEYANLKYKELEQQMQKYAKATYGHGYVYVATVDYPAMLFDYLVGELKEIEGSLKEKSIHLQPLMTIVGDHANNDMAGDYEKGEADEDQSWKWQLEKKGWKVETHMKGLGDYKEINNIYLEHLKAAIADGNKE